MNKKRSLIITVIVAAAVLLSILLYTMLANHPPVIASLEAEAERVFPSGSTQIVCTASDPDGDELSYEWSYDDGERDGEGATVTWTAPDSGGSYNVTVTVTDGRGGEVTKHVTITVMANRPPEITNLTSDAAWTTPSGSLRVTCDAEDPDGDELSYEWTATAGNITGTGAAVNWTAPEEVGIYDITVVVSDDHGGSATRTLHISVVTGQPPVIEALLVTAEHKYLKEYAEGYKVGRDKEFRIECEASHPDDLDLSYHWECDGGEISGDGFVVTWIAPDEKVTVTVTVTVSDAAGNMVSESVGLRVVSCSEFG